MFGEDYSKVNAISTYDCMPYLMYAIHKSGGSEHGKVLIEVVADIMHINEEYKNRVSAKDYKGRNRYHFELQVRFAKSALIGAGFLKPKTETPTGYWELTKEGEDAVQKLLEDADNDKYANELRETVRENYKKRAEERKEQKENEEEPDEVVAEEDENDYEADLESICKMDPFEFERLSISLIKAMGGELKETTRSADGGIDGEGFIDTGLIRFRVVLQVKRFARDSRVSEKLIRDFLGAKDKFNAEKGIFITTSSFATSAKELANEKSIKLIDGDELIELMRKHEVGYKRKLDL